MARHPTLRDIAVQAGVGVATVDRVLNRRAPVTPKTATRVLAAAQALNYHARGLMRQRIDQRVPARTLGFILQGRGKWFYQSLARHIRDAAHQLSPIATFWLRADNTRSKVRATVVFHR